MKKNYQTSEFWFTVVTMIFSALYITGFIKDFDQKEDLIQDVSHAVESVFLISGQVLVLKRYISSRSEQKKAAEDVKLAKIIAEQIAIHEENKKNDRRKQDEKSESD